MSSIEPALEIALNQAMALARQGKRSITEDFIQDLRQRFDLSRLPQAAIRIMLAEGVMLAYAGEPQLARDRLRRTLALCQLEHRPGLTSLAHAWFAFVELGAGRTTDCVQHAFDALKLGKGNSDPACARAASLLGAVYAQCGDSVQAREWFELARRLASRDHDEIMTSTVIFNMAACRFANARVRMVCEGAADALDSTDVMFLRSSEHYDRGAGLAVQSYLHAMLQGFAHSALSEHAQALTCFERFDGESTPAEWKSDALVPAERAWCRLQCGDREGALADARNAQSCLDPMADQGEAAIAHRRLSAVFEALGQRPEAQQHERQCQQALDRFRQTQAQTKILLDSYAVDPRRIG